MNLFETLVVVILTVYVLAYLIFVITGRINSRKERKEDVARADKSLEWEEQLKVLTKRLGEISTENQRLMDGNRQYAAAYSKIYYELQDYKKKYGELHPVDGTTEQETPKDGHMKVSDKLDMEKQYGEES